MPKTNIKFIDILTNGTPKAVLALQIIDKDQNKNWKIFTLSDRDIIEKKTNNPEYNGFVVEKVKIDMFTKIASIKFSNGIILTLD
jgi:hypothetical protein